MVLPPCSHLGLNLHAFYCSRKCRGAKQSAFQKLFPEILLFCVVGICGPNTWQHRYTKIQAAAVGLVVYSNVYLRQKIDCAGRCCPNRRYYTGSPGLRGHPLDFLCQAPVRIFSQLNGQEYNSMLYNRIDTVFSSSMLLPPMSLLMSLSTDYLCLCY